MTNSTEKDDKKKELPGERTDASPRERKPEESGAEQASGSPFTKEDDRAELIASVLGAAPAGRSGGFAAADPSSESVERPPEAEAAKEREASGVEDPVPPNDGGSQPQGARSDFSAVLTSRAPPLPRGPVDVTLVGDGVRLTAGKWQAVLSGPPKEAILNHIKALCVPGTWTAHEEVTND